jgi:hypothetical protein
VAPCYFSFTKSSTKIAQTPTVMGNSTKEASRSGPPLGRANVATIIARAVNTPRINLLFQFMGLRPHFSVWTPASGSGRNRGRPFPYKVDGPSAALTGPKWWACLYRFSGLFMFVIRRDVPADNKSLFEEAINLAQFPEDQNK